MTAPLMTKRDALLQAEGALKAMAALELRKCATAMIENGYDDDRLDAALAGCRAQLDDWLRRTLADLTRWMDREFKLDIAKLH